MRIRRAEWFIVVILSGGDRSDWGRDCLTYIGACEGEPANRNLSKPLEPELDQVFANVV
jgi:hypothetical protein